MFDRSAHGRLDDVDIAEDLHRFAQDPYLTKYLCRCFNPEFKVLVAHPKDLPVFEGQSGGISLRKRRFDGRANVI